MFNEQFFTDLPSVAFSTKSVRARLSIINTTVFLTVVLSLIFLSQPLARLTH